MKEDTLNGLVNEETNHVYITATHGYAAFSGAEPKSAASSMRVSSDTASFENIYFDLSLRDFACASIAAAANQCEFRGDDSKESTFEDF